MSAEKRKRSDPRIILKEDVYSLWNTKKLYLGHDDSTNSDFAKVLLEQIQNVDSTLESSETQHSEEDETIPYGEDEREQEKSIEAESTLTATEGDSSQTRLDTLDFGPSPKKYV